MVQQEPGEQGTCSADAVVEGGCAVVSSSSWACRRAAVSSGGRMMEMRHQN